MKKTAACLLAAFLGCMILAGGSARAEDGDEIMLQGFHWNAYQGYQGSNWYGALAGAANNIADAGFDMVWFPPPSKSGDNAGYLPNEWYVLNSKYGSQGNLQSAIGALHNRGVFCIADIVINHRNGTFGWGDFTNPSFANNNAAIAAGDEYCCETGNWDTGEGYDSARDLDHTNSSVRQEIKQWQSWLMGVGFDGWRYDMVKGFGPGYLKEYNDASRPYISVGEFFDYDRQKVVNWIDGTQGASRAFDFPTRDILYRATVHGEYWRLRDGAGKAGGLIGVWPQRAITFLENHDTEEARGGAYSAAFPQDKTVQGYAYLLTHPGIPCVFWNDWFWDHRAAINTLLAIRRQQGIRDNSSLNIVFADSGGYAAIVNGNTAVKIGGSNWAPTGNWTLATSGNQYAVWKLNGSGGGGGCTDCPTTVSTVPAAPTAGQAVTVWYPSSGRVLANSAQVNLYWGTNGWTGVQTTPMTNRGGGTWSAQVTLPANATQLNFVFNNGSQWDNNSNANWNVTVTGSGGGGGGTVYRIQARHSGKVLEVENSSTANGGNVRQWAYGGGNNQKWRVEQQTDGYYRLTNVGSGKVLDIAGVSTANGANVQQWTDAGGQNQRFSLSDVGGGFVSIVARHSGKALDVANISTADGGNVHQWSYVGGSNQQWQLVPVQ